MITKHELVCPSCNSRMVALLHPMELNREVSNKKLTKSILFMKCTLFIDENIIFTADGIFKIIRNRGKKDPS